MDFGPEQSRVRFQNTRRRQKVLQGTPYHVVFFFIHAAAWTIGFSSTTTPILKKKQVYLSYSAHSQKIPTFTVIFLPFINPWVTEILGNIFSLINHFDARTQSNLNC